MTLTDNLRSSLYMMLSMLGFTLNDLLIKSLGGLLPTTQVIAVRGGFLSLLIILMLWHRGLLVRWRDALHKRVLGRAICEAGATLLFLTALIQLPFANLVALLQALPLAVTVGAALFLFEPVGWRRWLAIVVGLIGVLVIIRPGLDGFHYASLLVLASVVMAAARDLITRTIPSQIPSLLVTGSSAVYLSLVGIALTSVSGDWVPMSLVHILKLVAASGFLFFGYHFVILSMRTGEIAYVVPYRYTSLLWAILLGYVFFDEVPDRWTMIGATIVISMGLYTIYREVVRKGSTSSQGR